MRLRVSYYYVGDLKKATGAYSSLLGLSPSYTDKDWVRFQLDGGNLALHLNEELPEASEFRQVQYGAVVSFTVKDLQTTLPRAEGSGFHQVGEIQDLPYGRQVHLRDPWGNRLSLIEPKE